jgi:hypothetical protein
MHDLALLIVPVRILRQHERACHVLSFLLPIDNTPLQRHTRKTLRRRPTKPTPKKALANITIPSEWTWASVEYSLF